MHRPGGPGLHETEEGAIKVDGAQDIGELIHRSILSADAQAGFADVFCRYYGPTMNAFEAADREHCAEELRAQLEALFTAPNTSHRADRTRIPAHYLHVSIHCSPPASSVS